MRVIYHKKFVRQIGKLPENIRNKFKERLIMLLNEPFNPTLNNHLLHGKYADCRSINVTGDFRAVFKIGEDGLIFLLIGTHSELYS
jgi:addiction module RelE/StbE family toxin